MRCDECKIEPVTPGHFCECCGRKLSLQERKALDEQTVVVEKKPAETSWGEPAPVLAKAQPGQRPDRLVGVHFAPEPYVDPVEEVAPPQVDPNLDAHFDAHFAALEAGTPLPAVIAAPPAPPVAPTLPATSHVVLDPILEAHFAGLVPVEAASVPVVSSLPAEAPAVPKVAVPTPVDEPTADDPAAHLDSDAPGARCESCGGPADEADLCSPCQQAFHSLLDSHTALAPAAEAVAPVLEEALAPATEVAVAPVVVAAPAAVAIPEPPAAPAVAIAVAPVAPAPAVQAPVAAAAPAPVKSTIQIKKPAPAPVVEAPVEVAPPQPKAPKPAPVAAAVATTAPQPSSVRTIAAGAAIIVVVAAIGFPLSRLWLGGQETSPIIRETQPAPIVQPAAARPEPEVTPVSAAVPVATTARHESAVVASKPAPAAPVAPAAPKTTAATTRPNAARVPPKTARQPVTPVKPVAAIAVPSPVVAAPAPEALPAPVAAPEPKPEPPAAPVGPFFELRDVNETPRVATRVEPQVPDEFRDRQLNEVVIVRVLVTQAGQPLMVNLLRKSKSGASLDHAIVAAVKQWTFVPAKKRGEAVSCWFHVGVPVSRANH